MVRIGIGFSFGVFKWPRAGRHSSRTYGVGPEDGFPPVTDIEVALVAAPQASEVSRTLAEAPVSFGSTVDPQMAV
jgi:hypothetical protein